MALVRSFAVVGVNTLGSRVLGFARDILIAAALGTGVVADAWVVAFRFPNLFRRIFAEGAFNAAFVPLFARRLEEEGRPAAKRFAEDSLSVLLTALLALTLLAQLAMPWLMAVLAPGFLDNPAQYDLAVLFTQIAFPYLLFMSLVALFGGILNALGFFALASATPMILNIVLILAVLYAAPLLPTAGHALVWGVALAGLLQFLSLFWGLERQGFRLRLRRPRLTPGVRRLIALGVPGVLAGGITQVNILVGTMISTFEEGAAAVLYYADRVYQLPLGVIGVAIGIVMLPELSRRLRAGDEQGVHDGQNRALEFALLLTLPAAAALLVIPLPIANVLFERGAFTPEDTRRTAQALLAFGIGLPAFVLIKVFSPGYFAREDTVTPLKFAAAGVLLNMAASVVLFFPWGAGLGYLGIAIATTLAGWLNALLLAAGLWRRGAFRTDDRLRRRVPRILAAVAFMAGVLLAGEAAFWSDGAGTLAHRATVLAGLVAAGGASYLLAALSVGAARPADLRQALRRRRAV